ncbi:histidine phosphatase family protein [Anaerosporobacter sp.]|uniref:histidine phosphatase family protein n=1 Tax=Anaerosporobacter sp. TaxID=1872529 RepID=UPI00286F71AE|nr:histidine phosphatase family protein [Anaerosporobacter sp.]
MNIYLIRHARQNSKLCNVNVELSEVGRKQADLLGSRLVNYQIDALYSSHYYRAKETAEIVNTHLNVSHTIREELREIDFGDLEGNEDSYNYEHYGEFLKERTAMTSDLAFPSGECGEDVWNRAKNVLDEIICTNYENVAVVAHGGTIRSIVTGLLGMDQANKLQFGLSLENTSITQVVYHKERNRFYIERFNDYAHLERNPELLRRSW